MASEPTQRTGASQTIVASAILIAVLSLASRVLGLVRDRALASTFGAGAVLDAYTAAFRIPDLLFNLIGLGALSAAFLPVYMRLRRSDVRSAYTFAATAMSNLVVLLGMLCVVGAVFAHPLIRAMAPGFPPQTLSLAVTMSRTIFLATFLLSCSTVIGVVLQAEERFAAYAAAPLLYNLGIIVGILVFVPRLGPIGLAWGVVLGAMGHVGLQWAAVRRAGFQPRWQFRLWDREFRTAMMLLVPRILGLASDQFALVALTAIASTLAAGTLAAFTFADNIQTVPIALVGIAFAIAAFPQLAAAVHAHDAVAFRERFSATARTILLLIVPAAVLLMTLKAQIVRVLLGSGAFGWNDTVQTLRAVEAFGFGLIPTAFIPLLARAFYAAENTRTPFIIAVAANVIAIAVAFVMRTSGAQGLALGVTVGATVQAGTLFACLRFRTGPLEVGRIAFAFGKFSIAALAMATIIQVVKTPIATMTGTNTFFGIACQGAVASLLGIGTYLAVGVLLRSEEITALARTLHRRVLRAVALPFGGADEARG